MAEVALRECAPTRAACDRAPWPARARSRMAAAIPARSSPEVGLGARSAVCE